jgi:hypothetical protein
VVINAISAGGGGGRGLGSGKPAPTVNAGIDQLISLPGAATLSTANDDRLLRKHALGIKKQRPGTFGNASSANTTVTFLWPEPIRYV